MVPSPEHASRLRIVEGMATKKIEDGIRGYLNSLGTSDKPVVDREAVKAVKAQIKAEADPIAKVRLYAALEAEEAGRVPDNEGEKAVFVAEAKAWAEAEGIPGSAFQSLGVPDDVLKAAGFELTGAGRAGKSSRPGTSGTRAPALPFEDVVRAARRLGNGWKLSDLAAALDRDPGTTRNYVNRLIKENIVRVEGDDPQHDGRGRAAKVYSLR